MNQLILILLLFFSVFTSCMENEPKRDPLIEMNPKELRNKLMEINREFVEREDLVIDAYTDSLLYEFEKTGTGLRIAVYKDGNNDTAQVGMLAVVKYKITDLQGNLIYQSKNNKSQSFLVGKDNVEQGLHEAIQKMTVGSKAIIVLPAHLAHGLSGDNAKIPPQTALVYDIELVDLQEI